MGKKWGDADLEAWAKKEIPDNFKPEPTVFTGGLDRMVQLWEASRDCNDGGYGSGVTQAVKGWGHPSSSKVTSCSPFTGTVIGMMFDSSGETSNTATYSPKCDQGNRSIGVAFYALHNGYYFSDPDADDLAKNPNAPLIGSARKKWFRKNKYPVSANSSADSCLFFNLGYEIDPRDMRRGDLVAIDWTNGHGHATFCWDVHLDDSGAVDCFLFLSANGGKNSKGYFGLGVSVSSRHPGKFFDAQKVPIKKKGTMFENKDDYTTFGHWQCLPKVRRKDIKRDTFKGTPPALADICDDQTGGVGRLKVVRFWGFAPPDQPHGNVLGDNADIARRLTKWTQPGSNAMGSSTPSEGRIEGVTSTKVSKSEPDPVKTVPPKEAPQKKEQAVAQQMFVERSLGELFHAEWLTKDPGEPDSVADAKSTETLKEFQGLWKIDGEDGVAGPKTQASLKQAIHDLHEGKPNPHKKTEDKPVITHVAWSANKVVAGAKAKLTIKGEHLDLVKAFEVALTDKKSGKSETVGVTIVVKHGHGSELVSIPASFGPGSQLTMKVSGGGAQKPSNVVLNVTAPPTAKAQSPDWNWDEKKWPASMTDQLKQLRLVQPQTHRTFTVRRITQYGVWDQMSPGDTPVLDKNGREIGHVDRQCLYMADLEGTMRLDGRILNLLASGNVFDPQTGRAASEKFNPKKSKWVDVTDRAPWGMGAKGPLIPYRSLAHNAAKERGLYGKKVFIEQLAGLKLPTGEVHNGMCIVVDAGAMVANEQLDLFVGPESNRISLPAQCNVEILA